MAEIREWARSALRRLVLPVPQRERTLNVVPTTGPLPAYGHRCLCITVAIHGWRTAHENGCTKIRVHNGSHKHEFETIDVLKHIIRDRLGYFPTAVQKVNGQVPRFLATRGMQALGAEFDITRPVFTVPVKVEPAPAPISGDPGGKETAV